MIKGVSDFIYDKENSYLVDKARKDFCKVGGLNDFVLKHNHYMLVERVSNETARLSFNNDIIKDKEGNCYAILYNNFELWVNSFS